MSQLRYLLPIAISFLHSCNAPTGASAHERADSLLGTWAVVSGDWGGNEYKQGGYVGRDGVHTPGSPVWTWTFAAEKYSWKVETSEGLPVGRLGARAYRTDATKHPVELDLSVPGVAGPDEIIPDEFMSCIYRIEGETLTLFSGSPRPRSFSDEADQHLVLTRK